MVDETSGPRLHEPLAAYWHSHFLSSIRFFIILIWLTQLATLAWLMWRGLKSPGV